ncbi:MAG: POTRA domain-containing protein [Synergistaceae bacterium]
MLVLLVIFTGTSFAETTVNSTNKNLQTKVAEISGPKILSIEIQGNKEVVKEHILAVLVSKVGDTLDEEKLRKDAEAIFELGFFVATDYKVSDTENGATVTFLVQENPVVSKIEFKGNTVYKSEKLTELLFTKPGMIFNRTFFRNDLQRIKEKYQQDGYVMANIADVQIDGDAITVVIIEPKISQIVIQGNKITKKHIVERYLKIKEGELFDSNKLRLTVNRLQSVGFFENVNVNFEPGENKDDVIVVITVEEGRTSRLGFSIAYGTQSGFGGGMNYENFNIGGKGLKLSTGFDLGNRKEYWLSLEQPYMGGKVTAWKIGGYKRNWNDLTYYFSKSITMPGGTTTDRFDYDRDKLGAYIGFGRKFKENSKYNWYVTLDWHEVENTPVGYTWDQVKDIEVTYDGKTMRVMDDLGEGKYYSALLSLRRFNLDEYLPYSKGDVETLNVQYGTAKIKDVSGDFNYFKYWLEAKVYIPVERFLKDFFESTFSGGADKPILFAARMMIGSSSGNVPYEEMYALGGDNTLRGFRDEEFRGEDMLLGNFELRIPLEKAFGLVVFYDIGRAWRKDSGIGWGSDIGDAPGLGVRLKTPLGNLRLDYATGSEDRFHFGFGEMF